MARTKSEFRATRERVGMTQALLAREMGVSQRSVRYWEDPLSQRQPPEEAWDILNRALRMQQKVIAFGMLKLDQITANADVAASVSVKLPYWLNESDYVQWSTDADNDIDGDWRMANANNLALALRLEERGITVKWVDGNPARPALNESHAD